MPRNNGIYSLPSPPSPLQPDTPALAGDMNTLLSDIATALTQSLPTDGSAAMTADLNANNHNIAGVYSLNAGAITTGNVTTTYASIGHLVAQLDANSQSITGINQLQGTGTFAWQGAGNFYSGLGVNGTLTAWNAFIAEGSATFYGTVATAGSAQIAGNGISYTGIGGAHYIGFTWNGSIITVFVDGASVGTITGTREAAAMEQRLAEVEKKCAQLIAWGHELETRLLAHA